MSQPALHCIAVEISLKLTLTWLLSESEMEAFTVSGALERTTSTLFFPSTPHLADITYSVSRSLPLAPGLAPLMTQYACLACTLCQEHMQAPKLSDGASLSALGVPVWPCLALKEQASSLCVVKSSPTPSPMKWISVVWPGVQRPSIRTDLYFLLQWCNFLCSYMMCPQTI